MSDPHNLKRFVDAQSGIYDQACAELRRGCKTGHWMWFIFPQLRGLGHSETALFYGIASRQEAEMYLAHPVLGARLRECSQLLNLVEGRTIEEIMGYPDDLKLRSSMTLFSSVTQDNQVFKRVLDRYFAGRPDQRTLDLL